MLSPFSESFHYFGNVSSAFRSAGALGVHVVSCDANKRYKDNRHVSMGAQKWLDIELWDATKECLKMLKSRGYRSATTHVGMEALHCSIPMAGMVDSFNVSVVVGILMHHAGPDRTPRKIVREASATQVNLDLLMVKIVRLIMH
ncbi:hypothetical protein Fmac_031477 [Flemingia macrophylla]|uniref:tRNA/rRNA methyltransferase SpoU type domain-containing protein n=1 Tax=Flemingia macrophylla TaxID=520843 RepID=A0ABD1L261_9FABA